MTPIAWVLLVLGIFLGVLAPSVLRAVREGLARKRADDPHIRAVQAMLRERDADVIRRSGGVVPDEPAPATSGGGWVRGNPRRPQGGLGEPPPLPPEAEEP